MTSLNDKFRQSKILGPIFHTLDYCLQKELGNCESVLDLGCGPSSPLKHCPNIKYSVGVEAFPPYFKESKKQRIHTKYLNKKIEEVDFPKNSFDAVILIEVLEHLPKNLGVEILQKADSWAKKKIIISTPNQYFPMDIVDKNPHQKHLSGWSIKDLKKYNFKIHGVSGAKFMYLKENNVKSLSKKDAVYLNIRFKPQKLFYLLNAILQIFTYYTPRLSFGLFAVKNKNSDTNDTNYTRMSRI